MPIRCDVVTAERSVFSGEVDQVIAPAAEGEVGILPNHAPLLATLNFGELRILKANEETIIAIGGGFLEVRGDHVVVLADAAERAEEIDVAQAEEARQRATEQIALHPMEEDLIRAEAALRMAQAQLRVARRRGTGTPSINP